MEVRLRSVGVAHGLLRQERVNHLTGEQAILWVCPECGYTVQEEMTEEGPWYRTVVQGDSPGPEDAAEFAELAKTQAGRIELGARLASYPRHSGYYLDESGLATGEVPEDAPPRPFGDALRLVIK